MAHDRVSCVSATQDLSHRLLSLCFVRLNAFIDLSRYYHYLVSQTMALEQISLTIRRNGIQKIRTQERR